MLKPIMLIVFIGATTTIQLSVPALGFETQCSLPNQQGRFDCDVFAGQANSFVQKNIYTRARDYAKLLLTIKQLLDRRQDNAAAALQRKTEDFIANYIKRGT